MNQDDISDAMPDETWDSFELSELDDGFMDNAQPHTESTATSTTQTIRLASMARMFLMIVFLKSLFDRTFQLNLNYFIQTHSFHLK